MAQIKMDKTPESEPAQSLGKFGHRAKSQLCRAGPSLLLTPGSPSLHVALLPIPDQDHSLMKQISAPPWASGLPPGYQAQTQPITLVFTALNPAWVIPGMDEGEPGMESQLVLATDALALCPLCFTAAFGLLSWKKDNGLVFILSLQHRKESRDELVPISWQCHHGCRLAHSWKSLQRNQSAPLLVSAFSQEPCRRRREQTELNPIREKTGGNDASEGWL